MTRRGFSLIETIFAASILSLVMMVLFNLYPSSLLAVRRAEHRLEATTLAQSILETKRAEPFSVLAAKTPDLYYTRQNDDDLKKLAPGSDANGIVKEDGVTLVPSFKVFHVSGTDPSRMLGLQAVVEWDENQNTQPNLRRHQKIVHELWICDVKK